MRFFLALSLAFVRPRGIAFAKDEYHVVCDAGSSGTRLYVFRLASGAEPRPLEPHDLHENISQVFVQKMEHGLSAYVDDPAAAVPPFLELFSEAAMQVPLDQRRTTPTLIYGTAGMRALPMEQQEGLWRALEVGLIRAPSFPFDKENVKLQTLSGYKEGLWAMYAANVLAGRASWELEMPMRSRFRSPSSILAGILDLGGASMQVALPIGQGSAQTVDAMTRLSERIATAPPGPAKTPARPSSLLVTDDMRRSGRPVVESYQGFGANVIRQQMLASTPVAMSACYQSGSLHALGPGNASACRSAIREFLREQILDCQEWLPSPSADEDVSCPRELSHRGPHWRRGGHLEFFALTGYFYAADFLRWWLTWNMDWVESSVPIEEFAKNFPSPTLEEYTAVVDALCASDLAAIEARTADPEQAHGFTTTSHLQHRCFQANYGVVFMGDVLGIPRTSRLVTFAHEMHGQVLEWPLGAVLESRTAKREAPFQGHGDAGARAQRPSTLAAIARETLAAVVAISASAWAIGARRRLKRPRLPSETSALSEVF